MWIGHRKEIRKVMFRALALRSSEGKNLIASFSLIPAQIPAVFR